MQRSRPNLFSTDFARLKRPGSPETSTATDLLLASLVILSSTSSIWPVTTMRWAGLSGKRSSSRWAPARTCALVTAFWAAGVR